MAPTPAVVCYDANCRFCRLCAIALARVDRRQRFAIVPLDDAEAPAVLERLGTDERAAILRVVEGEQVKEGGQAVLTIAAGLPLTGPLAQRALASAPARDVADRIYALVAARRSVLSRLVPDVPVVRRP